MKTTIISICYKLRKDITDDYLIQIKRLLIIKNPIVIYTDEYCFDFIFKIRKDYGYSEITKIILVPFNETFFYNFVISHSGGLRHKKVQSSPHRFCSISTELLKCLKYCILR